VYWTDTRNWRNWRNVLAKNPLVSAFVISLIVHALLFSGWRVGKTLGWWEYQATWLLKLTKKLQAVRLVKTPPPPAQQQMREIPLSFLEVDPALAVPEPPKEAKYYGAHNAVASNPDERQKTDPKIDGKQTKVVRTEDVPKPKPFPLQPAAPPEPKAQEQPKPQSEPAGDLAKLDTSKLTLPDANSKPIVREKPRTLAEARVKNMLAGQKVEQDGGMKTRGKLSLATKQTPFGSYDQAFIAAVQQRWYDLLETSHFTQQSGKVVLEFRLMYDGPITGMKMNDNDVGDLLGLLCERAILDPAPFAPWPSDMRRLIGQNYREVTFTFYYN